MAIGDPKIYVKQAGVWKPEHVAFGTAATGSRGVYVKRNGAWKVINWGGAPQDDSTVYIKQAGVWIDTDLKIQPVTAIGYLTLDGSTQYLQQTSDVMTNENGAFVAYTLLRWANAGGTQYLWGRWGLPNTTESAVYNRVQDSVRRHFGVIYDGNDLATASYFMSPLLAKVLNQWYWIRDTWDPVESRWTSDILNVDGDLDAQLADPASLDWGDPAVDTATTASTASRSMSTTPSGGWTIGTREPNRASELLYGDIAYFAFNQEGQRQNPAADFRLAAPGAAWQQVGSPTYTPAA